MLVLWRKPLNVETADYVQIPWVWPRGILPKTQKRSNAPRAGHAFATNPLLSPWVALGLPGGRPLGMAADTRINGGNIFFIYLLTVMQQGYPVMAQPTNYRTRNTTVVVNQPAPIVFQQGMRDWSSDLCGCCEDCYSCELNNFKVSRKRKESQN